MKKRGKMGKYVRKTKIDGEAISLMDVPSGVLTRAKSLALQRSSSSSLPMTDSGASYLQLRSRLLQKKPPIVVIRSNKRRKETRGRSSGSNPESLGAESALCGKDKELSGEINKNPTSFLLQLQATERTTRESTPCSLIRNPEINTSSVSSTKLNNGTSDNSNQREEILSVSHRHLPTTPEMDAFFSGPEEEQLQLFIDKYNFDPVNEQPLPGRFEWKRVDD